MLGRSIGVAEVGLGLDKFPLRLRDLLLGSVRAGPGSGNGCRACSCGGHGLIVLLLGNLLLFHQLLVASQIVLRLNVVSLGLLQLGLGGFELLLRRLDPGAGIVDVGLGR